MHQKFVSVFLAICGLFGLLSVSLMPAGANLPVTSSWLGNSWSTYYATMPLTIDDIGVSGNGIVGVASHYAEGQNSLTTIKNGRRVFVNDPSGISVAAGDPDNKYLFVGGTRYKEYDNNGNWTGNWLGGGVAKFQSNGLALGNSTLSSFASGPLSGHNIVGLAQRNGFLYVSDTSNGNDLYVYDAGWAWSPTELPTHHFTVPTGVGRLAVDGNGNIWVISGNNVLYLNGNTGATIATAVMTAPEQPWALAVDTSNRLLVADWGPDNNIKIFTTAGTRVGTVGITGGIGCATPQGVLQPLAFESLAGIAVDANNNLYVACHRGNWPELVCVESYAPNGSTWSTLNWRTYGNGGGNTASLDPADDTRGYSSSVEYTFDWSQPVGKEATFYAVTARKYDDGQFTQDPRFHCGWWWTSQGVRHIAGERFLFGGQYDPIYRFTSATGERGLLSNFFDGNCLAATEVGFPPNQPNYWNATWLWRDSNGDQKFDANEYSAPWDNVSDVPMSPAGGQCEVDANGNLYWFPSAYHVQRNYPYVTELPVASTLDAVGNPVYSLSTKVTIPAPTSLWNWAWTAPHCWIDAETGDLVLAGYPAGQTNGITLAYYAGWRASSNPGTMTPTWTVSNLGANLRLGAAGDQFLQTDVAGVRICGDYVFVSSSLSQWMRVYQRSNGAFVDWLHNDIQTTSTNDAQMLAMSVSKRACGEYILMSENFLGNNNLLFRWNPTTNLSFEAPAQAANSYTQNPSDGSWTFVGASGISGSGSTYTSGNPAAPNGSQVAYLTGNSDNYLYQSLVFGAGQTYALSLSAAKSSGSASNERFTVLVDNMPQGTFTPSSTSYTTYTTNTFIVPPGGHMVKIAGHSNGTNTVLLDNIQIVNGTPAVPAGLQATPGLARVTLTWTLVPGATSYNVYRGSSSNGESTTPIATGVTTSSYVDTAISLGSKYYYKITAVNDNGESAKSNEASALSPGENLGFEMPIISNGTSQANPTGGSWIFSSNSGIARSGCQLAIDNPPAPEGVQAAYISNTGSISQVFTLTAGTYVVTCQAAGSTGFGWLPNDVSVTVDGVSYGVVYPGWNQYGSYSTSAFTVTAGNHTIAFVGLSTGGAYRDTLIDAVQIQSASGAAPANLTTVGGANQVSLRWNSVAGASSYNVYRGVTSGGENTTPIATGITTPNYADTSGDYGTLYYYKVAAVCGGVTTAQSNEANAMAIYYANFGFELPTLNANTYVANPTGCAWTFTGTAGIATNNAIDNTSPAYVNGWRSAPEGNQWAYIRQQGSFSQTMNLSAGTYHLTFTAIQSHCNWYCSDEDFNVTVDGAVVGHVEPSDGGLGFFTTDSFTVETGNHTIAFVGLNSAGTHVVPSGDNVCLIDNIVLNLEESASAPSLIINSAYYEAINNSALRYDVTDLLQGMVTAEGVLAVTVSNTSMGGDPAPGYGKHLVVNYTINGTAGTCTVGEWQLLELSALPSPLTVTHAVYGVLNTPTLCADVTALVNSMVTPLGTLSVAASNDTLQCDPAVGYPKQLRVDYTLNGTAGSSTANEGQTITIP